MIDLIINQKYVDGHQLIDLFKQSIKKVDAKRGESQFE